MLISPPHPPVQGWHIFTVWEDSCTEWNQGQVSCTRGTLWYGPLLLGQAKGCWTNDIGAVSHMASTLSKQLYTYIHTIIILCMFGAFQGGVSAQVLGWGAWSQYIRGSITPAKLNVPPRKWLRCEQHTPFQEEKARLRCRAITYVGEFAPVQRSCRAPLPNGNLCPRRDRIKVRWGAELKR